MLERGAVSNPTLISQFFPNNLIIPHAPTAYMNTLVSSQPLGDQVQAAYLPSQPFVVSGEA